MGVLRACLLTLLSASFLSAFAKAADNATYDYIVVGSGPGGGTLAAKLAQAGESVLLLEAGDDQGENPHQKIGGLFNVAGNDPLMRWDFFVKYHSDPAVNREYDHLVWRTTSGEFYVGQDPPTGATQLGVYYPRTGTLGGCSTHNAMCAALPSNSDWDEIATLTGDSSWTAKNMRKHYINLENNHLVPKGTPGHGFDGFLDITVNTDEFLKNQSQAQVVLKAAAKQFGQDPEKVFDLVRRDLNSDDADRDKQQGLFGFPAHRDPMGRRVSARTVVVNTLNATDPKGAKKYPLTLSIHSFVTKVLFDTKSKNSTKPKATGVEYIEGMSIYGADPRYKPTNTGTTKQVFAKKEVIIAGGAFNTPQILMLSGIGPKAHLTDMKIPVVVDLPGVGQNLQDNTEYGVAAQSALNFTSTSAQCANTGLPDDPCLAPWEEGKGPYAQGPLDALMYTSSASVNGERDIFFFGLSGQSYRGYWPSTTVNNVPMDGPNTFDFSMVKFNPQGKRGTLLLTSNNPRDVPDINFRFFEEGGDIDVAALADAVEFGRKVFDSINGTMAPFTEVLPCTGGKRDCDVKKTIRAQTWSHHATSSAAIGADSDPLAVLDSKFRVRGVNGLRVVDAAAFPKTPGAFPVIPTFMLGMKGADVLLNG